MRDPIDEIREALAHPDFLERIDAIRGYDAAEKRLLDRLEAAESARRGDYQNWMTALDRNAELLAKLEAAEKERDVLRSLVVMRFDHDHPPQFVQGYDPHELNELVTAEHCRWFVAEIERLRTERDELRAMIQVALVVLDEVCGNINPERGYADELETDVKRAIAALSIYNAKGEEK